MLDIILRTKKTTTAIRIEGPVSRQDRIDPNVDNKSNNGFNISI